MTLWYDELLSLHRALLPFWEHARANPNAWELMLRLFASPGLIRIPALLAMIVSAALVARKGITSMLMFMVPGVLWMAIDARYYAGMTLAYLGSLFFAEQKRTLGLFAVAGMSIYIHPTAPAYVIPALVMHRSRWWFALPLVWLPRLINTASSAVSVGIASPDLWLNRTDAPYLATQAGLAIGAMPSNIIFALLWLAVCLVISFRASPQSWLVFLWPLVMLYGVSVFYEPVMFYRTMQPALAGLALLVGDALRGRMRLLALLPASIALLMMAQFDPGTHDGHIERGIAQVTGCAIVEDEFSRVSLAGRVPECRAGDTAEWIISTDPHGDVVFVTDGWHFPSIYFSQVR